MVVAMAENKFKDGSLAYSKLRKLIRLRGTSKGNWKWVTQDVKGKSDKYCVLAMKWEMYIKKNVISSLIK